MVRGWPLSAVGLAYAANARSAEARARAERAYRAVCRVPANRQGYLWLVEPLTRDELRALWVLARPDETDGLPWLGWGVNRNPAAGIPAEAFARVRVRLGLLAAGPEPDLSLQSHTYLGGDTAFWVPGVDDLRFAARGLPPPSAWGRRRLTAGDVRALWAAKKRGD